MTDYSARKLNSRIVKFIEFDSRTRACEPVGRVAVNFRRQKRAAVNVSTCRQIRRNTSSSRVALTRISISSKFYFPSLPECSISAVTPANFHMPLSCNAAQPLFRKLFTRSRRSSENMSLEGTRL